MTPTLNIFIFSLIIGLVACILFAVQSKISFRVENYSSDSLPVQERCRVPLVSPESAHLQGWHKRAVSHPHPSPHSIIPEDDIVELALTSTGMVKPYGYSLIIFKSTANISSADGLEADDGNESYHYVVVDELGRVSVLPSTSPDINGILSLGRQVVLNSPMEVPWEAQDDVSCLPLYTVAIAPDLEGKSVRKDSKGRREMKTVRIMGYPGMNQIKVQNKGYDYLPDSVRDLFLLVLEAGEGDEERVDKVVIEKVEKGVRYYTDYPRSSRLQQHI